MYPPNDTQFNDTHVDKVRRVDGGWEISHGVLSFYVSADSPITPEPGMLARFYGKGVGSRVRGLFLDGTKVFYRTEAEDEEHFEIEMYGATAADWLKRWDDGRTVWSIEMGGIGPGYEQCIHITCAEILRHMIAADYIPALWDQPDEWKKTRDEIEAMSDKNETIKKLGLSGAQWGAALNVALNIYRNGPRSMMKDERVKDRHIQVSRTFP